jgi:hypothetical protein
MYQKLICVIIVFFISAPAVFAAGGKVTIHNARFVYSMKYRSNDKDHVINFDPQNEGGQYRLRGKRNFQILEVLVNENGKEKVCKCGEDALFRWRTRHPVDINYKSEYEGHEGTVLSVTGTLDRKLKTISCTCE